MLTDTHVHLNYADFVPVKAIIEKAETRGISRFFIPNIDVSTVNGVLELGRLYPGCCFPMIGLHPTHVDELYEQQIEGIFQAISNEKVYGIGEVGLDLYHERKYIYQQIHAFEIQAAFASALKLPVIIHCRDAFSELVTVVKKLNNKFREPLRGIFHCFSGTKKQADELIDLGFFLGIGGIITYKNSSLSEVVGELPLEHLVLETDSPYLSPVPFRGKINEPANLSLIAGKVATVKQLSVEEVATVTTNNSQVVFGV